MDDGRYAGFKRIWETYQIDPAFREDMAGKTPGLFPAGEEPLMREAIQGMQKGRFSEYAGNPFVHEFCVRNAMVTRYVLERVQPSSFRNPFVYDYLQRIRNRCRMESAAIRRHPNIYYYPLAFELSQGCRVGCSFCGLMAERWTSDAPYDRKLWREILGASLDYLGDIVGEAPCYFATEPLDHPEYERFLADMDDVTGRVPQTTTAVADREPERLRSLICWLGEKRLREQARLRLSVRSIPQFYRMTRQFSPEELVHVEVLANNRESLIAASDSGRNRGSTGRQKIRYSICCVSGVKVNLASRSMTFLEPVLPDEEHPCGYRVLETECFTDGKDYARLLAALFSGNAISRLPPGKKLSLHPDIRIEAIDSFILLKGDGVGFRVPDNPLNETVIHTLQKGGTFEEVFRETALPETWKKSLWEFLDQLLQRGYVIVS